MEGESPSLHLVQPLDLVPSVNTAYTVPYTSTHTSPSSRAHLYTSLTSRTVPILTIAEANEYLSRPLVPNALFPSCPTIASRSIALTHSYFYVKPSQAVPSQLGLFLKRSIPRQRNRIFVGF